MFWTSRARARRRPSHASPSNCQERPPPVGSTNLLGRTVPRDGDFDDHLDVDRDPCLRTDPVDDDLDLSERRLDRGDAALVRDGGCTTSDEPATVDFDLPTRTGRAAGSTDHDREHSLQENVISQR